MPMPYDARLDVDDDGVIDQGDLDALFHAHLGARSGDANYVAWLDHDGNGVISASDFQRLVGYLGAVRPIAPPTLVLTPAAAGLPPPLLIAGAAAIVLMLWVGRPQRAAA
ncbi:MAG: EF-hand domain-containing protein [Dehalococcoidia bacterium]|nr:MAG: EF-hand domain-containing protein [Dehalococcoidia bacterium]